MTFIDQVDEADRPVSLVRRSEVFEEGANFRTAHVLVFDERRRLLLQRVAPTRERHPLRWGSSVAAYLHTGESYAEAAERRLHEELGLDSALRHIGQTAMADRGVTKFVGVFETTSEGQAPIILEPNHFDALRWLGLPDLKGELAADAKRFTPTLRHVFRFYQGQMTPQG